jgi:hypothetical protein
MPVIRSDGYFIAWYSKHIENTSKYVHQKKACGINKYYLWQKISAV